MFADGGIEKEYVPTAKRGVVFLSTIPTNMRPSEVKLHVQQFGPIFRTKFVAFPQKQKGKGSSALQFKNGYVEFLNKDDAISCVQHLNGQLVETKKRRKSHGQLWNISYLEDFSWGALAEEREEKVRRRKEMEYKVKEEERSANEAFRRMVLMKQKQKQQQTSGDGSSQSGGQRTTRRKDDGENDATDRSQRGEQRSEPRPKTRKLSAAGEGADKPKRPRSEGAELPAARPLRRRRVEQDHSQ